MLRLFSLAIVSLPLLTVGCASTGSDHAESSHEESDGDDDAPGDVAEKIQNKEREAARARLELKIARQSAEASARTSKNKVEEASFELQKAVAERDNFKTVEQVLKVAEAQLEVDRAKERTEEARQNLDELEKMYAQEDFAEITKELVLMRGRSQLALSQRDLEIDTKKLAQVSEYENPAKLRDLEMEVVKAEKELREAKAEEQKSASEGELLVLKAEHEIQELEQALAKLKKKAGDKTAAKDAEKPAKGQALP